MSTMVREVLVEEAKTARQWAQIHKIPYAVILTAVKDGRLDAMRFTPRGQIYIMPSAMLMFLEDAKKRAREEIQ